MSSRTARTPRRSFLTTSGALAAGLLALAGCGSDDLSGTTPSAGPSTAATPTTSADPALRALLPQSVQDSGVLRVGTNAEYAPNEFLRGTEVVGMDVDVMTAVAAKLGVRAEFANAGFDTLIDGVGANRYDAAISSFTINSERLAQVTMVQYYEAGTQWLVKAGNPEGVQPDDACGRSVSAQVATTQIEVDLPARSQACTAAGKPAITVLPFDSQEDATAALVQGRVQATVADSPVAAYAAQQTEGLETIGEVYDSYPYGVVVAKAQTQTADAISKALTAIAADGSYEAALQPWGAQDGAVEEFPVNPVVS